MALFVRAQQVAYRAALDLADQSLSEEGASVESILAEVARTLTPGENPRTGPTKSEASALRLLALVESRFKEVAREINDLPKLAIVSSVHSISGRADANNYQVIEMAHKLNYTPNLAHFKAWIKLEISGNVWTEILVAFHGLGRRDLGVLVGAACAYHQAYSDDNDLRLSIDLQLLSMSPFQITAYDELPDLEVRFKKWLETVLIAGLTYWRRGLIL